MLLVVALQSLTTESNENLFYISVPSESAGLKPESKIIVSLSIPSESASGVGYAGVGSLGEAVEAALEYRQSKQGSLSEEAKKISLQT